MDCGPLTRAYWAQWVDLAPEELGSPGVVVRLSQRRAAPLPGYPRAMQVYALCVGGQLAVSCAPSFEGAVRAALRGAGTDMDAFAQALAARTREAGMAGEMRRGHNFLYVGGGEPIGGARALAAADSPAYRAFYWELHGISEADWPLAYFAQCVEKGFSFGVFEGRRLACATDAPDMPHMAECVAEIGINTLPSFRGRGYASAASDAAARAIASSGRAPIWSCGQGNEASIRLALRVGFTPYARYLTFMA